MIIIKKSGINDIHFVIGLEKVVVTDGVLDIDHSSIFCMWYNFIKSKKTFVKCIIDVKQTLVVQKL